MKKLINCVVFFLLLNNNNSIYGQATGFPYEDATIYIKALQNIRSSADPATLGSAKQNLVSIVSYYFDTSLTLNDVRLKIASNYFLNKDTLLLQANPFIGSNPDALPTAGGSGILGMNVTNVADGIAKFLIERGKKELSMVFFERFREDLKNFPELKFVFPKSTEILADMESHNILSVLQELKDAFSKDLLNMPGNILSLRDITNTQCTSSTPGFTACSTRVSVINNVFNSRAGFDSRLLILPLISMQGVVEGNNVIEIANKISTDALICTQNDDVSGLFQLSSILLESFKTNETATMFLSQGKFKNLFYSEELTRVFMGLVYQKYNGKSCYNNLTIRNNNLQQIFSSILTARMKFYSALTTFDKVNQAYKKALSDAKIDNANYASIVSASLNMFSNLLTTTSDIIGGVTIDSFDALNPSIFKRLTKNINLAGELCSDIQQKNYSGIFNLSIKLVRDNKIFNNDVTKDRLIKYLSFAANLASATTSDEVQNALETVALPPGSYSIKQKSAFNISLNGYVGYGWDINNGNGVYAPVGFTGSVGLGKKHQWALSLFTSMIDVGGLVSYRLTDGVTNELKQEVRLESIISPSAQLMVGIPKTPMAVCSGWRLAPKLFYSSQTSFQTVRAKNVFNVAVSVDIPIFTLFNRPYSN